ncbi:MBT domain-containing protein 1-like [Uloborus diversus]|uniref:MBT domain-containing protein 1-like n=1 Tax=Uloborus diversus TaxID=327109 RepID=UPI00240A792B|nr:MBT domain-containing protein 1-like [Uloborus diversus]
MNDGSFDWRLYLKNPDFIAAPVSCFQHVALSSCWDNITVGALIEIRSPDCTSKCCPGTPCRYWLATIVKVSGYYGLVHYEGFDTNETDRWINLCTEPHIHPFGWVHDNEQFFVPPKKIEHKNLDLHFYDRIPGGHSLPNFAFQVEEHEHNIIKKGMRLEVVDKNTLSAMRSATVSEVVGGRLHIKYDHEVDDVGFWCHERSPLIHPVGWSQVIGHALKAKPLYARQSLKKVLCRTFEKNDATWDKFLPVYNPAKEITITKGMKLEAIDPLNLSTICVATITDVLRNNYLMIGIDGMMTKNGTDCFCYHASSPSIFPVGFCEENGIKLTTPKGYDGTFNWPDYLKKTKSKAAPIGHFQRPIPSHGFEEGMHLEAVDLMEPRLICVAYVRRVVGRLLRVHFVGWQDEYDQWCDCESPDLFPIGWCEVLKYHLEPPRTVDVTYKKKKKLYAGKKKRGPKRKKASDNFQAPPSCSKTAGTPTEREKRSLRSDRIMTIEDSSHSSGSEEDNPEIE